MQNKVAWTDRNKKVCPLHTCAKAGRCRHRYDEPKFNKCQCRPMTKKEYFEKLDEARREREQ